MSRKLITKLRFQCIKNFNNSDFIDKIDRLQFINDQSMSEIYFGAWSKTWVLNLWCGIIERGNTKNNGYFLDIGARASLRISLATPLSLNFKIQSYKIEKYN
ncbi:hypothetical protein BpHYR1_041189, partial [Brachionus plicatilis]